MQKHAQSQPQTIPLYPETCKSLRCVSPPWLLLHLIRLENFPHLSRPGKRSSETNKSFLFNISCSDSSKGVNRKSVSPFSLKMRACHPFPLLCLCVKSNLEGDLPDAQVQMRQHRLSDDWLRSQNWPTQTDLGRRETSTSAFPTLCLLSHQGPSRQPQRESVLQKDVLFTLNIWTQQRFTYSKSYISKHSPFRFLGMIPFG